MPSRASTPLIRSRSAGSVSSRLLAAPITPWHVPLIVITSSPSCSACAKVRAFNATCTSGSASPTTPALQQDAAVSSTTSIPSRPMMAIVDWYSSRVAPLAAQPGYNAYFSGMGASRLQQRDSRTSGLRQSGPGDRPHPGS